MLCQMPDFHYLYVTLRGPSEGGGFLALEFPAHNFNDISPMSLYPEAQQLIRQVEELFSRIVHVTDDLDLKVMASPVEQEHYLSIP
jgi:hypothetical protein